MDVKIRFNKDFPSKSTHKWIIIVDEVQHLVDVIEINRKSITAADAVDKFYIYCKAKEVKFSIKKEKKAIVS